MLRAPGIPGSSPPSRAEMAISIRGRDPGSVSWGTLGLLVMPCLDLGAPAAPLLALGPPTTLRNLSQAARANTGC